MNDKCVLETFESVASKYELEVLAKSLIRTIDGIGYNPERLRVFTNLKAYNNNVKSLKADTSKGIVLKERENSICVKLGNTPYVYVYCPVDVNTDMDDVNNVSESKPKYNSIFLGVGYSSKSFNMMKIIEQHFDDTLKYCVYTSPVAPKCLRIGFIGDWCEKDIKFFDPFAKSAHFDSPKENADTKVNE
jgi:hypothetical protein